MKKKALLLLLSALLFAGCGSSETPASSVGSSTPNIEVPVSQESSPVVSASSEESSEVPESEETPAPEQPSVSILGKVTNNNGFFVQAGNKVYFRIPTADAMAQSEIYQNFMDSIPGSTLAVLNTDTDEVTELSTDNNYGRIIFSNDILMAKSFMDDETRSYTLLEGLDMKTDSVMDFSGENYVGVDASGDYVAISYYDYDNYELKYVIYKDAEYYAQIPNSGLWDFVGFCDGTAVYITQSEDGDYTLWSYQLSTGEVVMLGTLPTDEFYNNPGTPEQLQVQGNMLYLTLGLYEGTGHFYSGFTMISADVHTEDSLQTEYLANTDEEYPNHAPRFIVNLGIINSADGIPGTADVNSDTGYLGYYDENGIWVPVSAGYGTVYSGDYEQCTTVEVAEYINGYIYIIQNEMVHTPENDIGWRTAYRRTRTIIKRIDAATGRPTILADVVSQ